MTSVGWRLGCTKHAQNVVGAIEVFIRGLPTYPSPDITIKKNDKDTNTLIIQASFGRLQSISIRKLYEVFRIDYSVDDLLIATNDTGTVVAVVIDATADTPCDRDTTPLHNNKKRRR